MTCSRVCERRRHPIMATADARTCGKPSTAGGGSPARSVTNKWARCMNSSLRFQRPARRSANVSAPAGRSQEQRTSASNAQHAPSTQLKRTSGCALQSALSTSTLPTRSGSQPAEAHACARPFSSAHRSATCSQSHLRACLTHAALGVENAHAVASQPQLAHAQPVVERCLARLEAVLKDGQNPHLHAAGQQNVARPAHANAARASSTSGATACTMPPWPSSYVGGSADSPNMATCRCVVIPLQVTPCATDTHVERVGFDLQGGTIPSIQEGQLTRRSHAHFCITPGAGCPARQSRRRRRLRCCLRSWCEAGGRRARSAAPCRAR